jgi:hypothetical protein
VQAVDTTGVSLDIRQDRHYGPLLTSRLEGGNAVLTRKTPGPDGSIATRHGPNGPWVFAFGEARGNRFFADENGVFHQDADYEPFGKTRPSPTGAQPGNKFYSNEQWNGGDASQLSASRSSARVSTIRPSAASSVAIRS